MIYHFLASNDSKMFQQHLDVEHFFHTFPGIFCFLTNPCLVQMIRLLGAIFQGATWLLLSGSRAPTELGIHPRAGVGAPTITQGGVNRFWFHFLRRKVLEVNKKQLVFFGQIRKKTRNTTFFFDGWFVFFQSK